MHILHDMCPHCGRLFRKTGKLIPVHGLLEMLPRASCCPGSEQVPRNPESDKRPLWSQEKREGGDVDE